MRRSDFLPVGAAKDTEQLERGYESEDSGGSDYSGGLAHAFRESDSDYQSELDTAPDEGVICSDFQPL